MSHARLERIASRVRSILAPTTDVTAGLNGLEVFDALHDQKVRTATGQLLTLEKAIDDLPRGVAGVTHNEKGSGIIAVTLSAETYDALERGEPHALFSLGHEIGHGYVHADLLLRIWRLPHLYDTALCRATPPTHEVWFDTEWQADAFAGAFLMPAAGLAALEARGLVITESLLRVRYGVSHTAAEIRMSNYRQRRDELLD